MRCSRLKQAEEALYWQSFEQLHRHPTEESATAAKRGFLLLANAYHPDDGDTQLQFLRVKDAYRNMRPPAKTVPFLTRAWSCDIEL